MTTSVITAPVNTFPIIKSPSQGQQLFHYLNNNKANKIFWNDSEGSIMDYMVSAHIWNERMTFHNFFKSLRERFDRLKIKKESYGDWDQTIRILVAEKNRTVFHLEDHCTCADINNWIIIHEFDEIHANLHIREIHPRGDYPRKPYPKKLNLKFWKDRDYKCEYIEKYHMTNLGSVYGDIRDKGYIISYKMWLPDPEEDTMENDIRKRLAEMDSDSSHRHHYYNEFKRMMLYIRILEASFPDNT